MIHYRSSESVDGVKSDQTGGRESGIGKRGLREKSVLVRRGQTVIGKYARTVSSS